MSLEQITEQTLKGAAIRELQDERTEVVDGDSDATDIPVADITTRDTLKSVLRYVAGVPTANLLSEAAITSDGNIQLSTTDTTGDKLVVSWWKKPETK